MNEPIDPVERLLENAFGRRPSPTDVRPSLLDVQRRARRRQHRRTAGMLGALAVVGVGGTVAVASRHDNSSALRVTAGDGGAASTAYYAVTTIACASPSTTAVPITTVPTTVLESTLPAFHRAEAAPTTSIIVYYPCVQPTAPVSWRCTQPLNSTPSDSWVYYGYCERVVTPLPTTPPASTEVPTSSAFDPKLVTSTTLDPLAIIPPVPTTGFAVATTSLP